MYAASKDNLERRIELIGATGYEIRCIALVSQRKAFKIEAGADPTQAILVRAPE